MYLSKKPDGQTVVYVPFADFLALETDVQLSALVAEANELAGRKMGERVPVEIDSASEVLS